MTSLSQRIAGGAEGAVRIVGQAAAWLGLALVLVVAGNVLGRYLLGVSSVAMQEAEWHLMAAGALFGMSYGLNQGGEVRVDVLYARFGPRLQAAIDCAAGIMLALCALALAWLSIGYVAQSHAIAEGSPDPGGLPMRYLLKGVLPVAFSLLAVQATAMALRTLPRLRPPHGGA